jgi:microcystin-dependent protein
MFQDPYIATITVFGGNFAPAGWMYCQGQLLSISEYTPLFALIGTTYGGDGQVTFALPDLRGRRPIHYGQAPSSDNIVIGQIAGSEQTTLLSVNLPMHNHSNAVLTGTPKGSSDTTGVNTPSNTVVPAAGPTLYGTPAGSAMGPYPTARVTALAGGNSPIPTISPYLAMNYIIAVEGIFPSRA